MGDKYLDLAQELKKTVEHMVDGDKAIGSYVRIKRKLKIKKNWSWVLDIKRNRGILGLGNILWKNESFFYRLNKKLLTSSYNVIGPRRICNI